jgi:L,D-transpeptidase ErfK/SrfK
MKVKRFLFGIILLFIFSAGFQSSSSASGAFFYSMPRGRGEAESNALTVVGSERSHIIRPHETLLDIARKYGLGFWELKALCRELDPWIPPEGLKLTIPAMWVLPRTLREGIVINVPEMRLYLFIKSIQMVKTYPVGIGVQDGRTPLGTFHITGKVMNPTWYVPPSLWKKHKRRSVPPGPENPLGAHWIALSLNRYGIHGTDFPWGVGRLVSHGCIRLYPEDITNLYSLVRIGMPVEIIYEPVKFGFRDGEIYIEAHEDIYHFIPDFLQYGFAKLKEEGLDKRVDVKKFTVALVERTGVPVRITKQKGVNEFADKPYLLSRRELTGKP